jgi:hypothetical protein
MKYNLKLIRPIAIVCCTFILGSVGLYWWFQAEFAHAYTDSMRRTLTPSPTPLLSPALKLWSVENHPSHWHEIFNGYGLTSYDPQEGIILEPKRALKPEETHSALILSKKTEAHPLKDFVVTIQAATERQIRTQSANPWEVFWIFFNHNFDTQKHSITNYFIMKPNGIELGKAFERTKQTILSTKWQPTLLLGKIYAITIIKVGNHVDVLIDGTPALSYSGELYDQPGSIGLYTEDARVHIYRVSVIPLNFALD